MQENLICLEYAVSAQTDADGIAVWFLPTGVGFTILGVSFAGSASGVTTATVDVQDDGTDVTGALALDISTAAGDYGAADNSYDLHIGGGSAIDLDLNLNAGNITGVLMLWGFLDYA